MKLLKNGDITSFKTLGFTHWGKERVLNHLANQGNPGEVPGDFVLIINGKFADEPFTVIVSSYISAIPYFYYTDARGKLYHGSTPFDVYQHANLKWRWNERALFFLNIFDHLIGTDSLHTEIKRFPRAVTLTNYDNKTEIKEYSLESAYRIISLHDAIAKYKNIAADHFSISENAFLSLSAGLDSRLLLATSLAMGVKPVTATMGNKNSTDAKIALAITKRFGLAHQQVSLEVNDYLDDNNRRKIVYATGGSKTLNHWHTYIYIHKAGYPIDYVHFAGSNGELVRSYYFDKGFLSKILQTGDYGLFDLYFRLKMRKGTAYLIEYFKQKKYFDEARRAINSSTSQANAMDRFDDYYSMQRVRHFIGNGLALYHTRHSTRSPFLDSRFAQIARALPRKHKLNSIFHKKSIEAIYPKLMEFGNNDNSTSIADYRSNLYFLASKTNSIGYSINNELLSSPDFRSSIVDDSILDSWITRRERLDLFRLGNIRQISFLATMAETQRVINEIDQSRAEHC